MYQHTIPILHQIDFSFFMGFLKSSYLRAEQKLGDLQVSQTSSALTNPTLGCHPKSMIRVDLCLDYTLKNWIGKIGHSKDMSSSKSISIEYGRCSSHFPKTIHVVSCCFFPCRVMYHRVPHPQCLTDPLLSHPSQLPLVSKILIKINGQLVWHFEYCTIIW